MKIDYTLITNLIAYTDYYLFIKYYFHL